MGDSSALQMQFLNGEGIPVITRPIDVGELLRRRNRTMDVGGGMVVRLDELGAAPVLTTAADEAQPSAPSEHADDDDDVSDSIRPPSDCHEVKGWYNVMDTLMNHSDHDPVFAIDYMKKLHKEHGWYSGSFYRRDFERARDGRSASHASDDDEQFYRQEVTAEYPLNKHRPPYDSLADGEEGDRTAPMSKPTRSTHLLKKQKRKKSTGPRKVESRRTSPKKSMDLMSQSYWPFSNNSTDTSSESDSSSESEDPIEAGNSTKLPENEEPPVLDAAARREVWSHFAPPVDKARTFQALRWANLQAGSNKPSYTPRSLFFHTLLDFASVRGAGQSGPRAERGVQRFVMYGGVSSMWRLRGVSHAHIAESELYEFNLSTAAWRRVEGKHQTSLGLYGHTATVVDGRERLILYGGVGPGGHEVKDLLRDGEAAHAGVKTSKSALKSPQQSHTVLQASMSEAAISPAALARYRFAFPPTPTGQRRAKQVASPSVPLNVDQRTALPLGLQSVMFDVDLATGRWQAVRTSYKLPLAFHTAVAYRQTVFIFGGLTDRMEVSQQLLAVCAASYSVRVLRRRQAQPCARYLHTAVRFGNWMIVYGGYNAENDPLSDCWAFDLVNERWEQLSCTGESGPRAGHAACVVGCRMMVIGGFELPLQSEGSEPLRTVAELNLIPGRDGNYVWRTVRITPPLPPVAFAAVASCGDHASLLLSGGITRAPVPKKKRTAQRRSRRSRETSETDESSSASGSSSDSESDETAPSSVADDTEEPHWTIVPAETPYSPFSRRWTTVQTFAVVSFPMKTAATMRRSSRDVDESDMEDEELPASFKAFVRRQEDFLKKKNLEVVQQRRKTIMEEREGMDLNLHMTPEEINLLLERCQECCDTFSAFKIDGLPAHVPERERRVRLVEDCVSLSRQVRDVMRSMKGSETGAAAVRSKTHRKKTGQKFEDHSAAKPFRRVVVMSLLSETRSNVKALRRMHGSLKTVEWEDKPGYFLAVDAMQEKLHDLYRAIKGILDAYINNRVSNLVAGAERHRLALERATQIARQLEHDKVFNSGRVDHERERVRRVHERDARLQVTGANRRARGASRAARLASPAPVPESDVQTAKWLPGTGNPTATGGSDGAVFTVTVAEAGRLMRRASRIQRLAANLAAHHRQEPPVTVAGGFPDPQDQYQATQSQPPTGPLLAAQDLGYPQDLRMPPSSPFQPQLHPVPEQGTTFSPAMTPSMPSINSNSSVPVPVPVPIAGPPSISVPVPAPHVATAHEGQVHFAPPEASGHVEQPALDSSPSDQITTAISDMLGTCDNTAFVTGELSDAIEAALKAAMAAPSNVAEPGSHQVRRRPDGPSSIASHPSGVPIDVEVLRPLWASRAEVASVQKQLTQIKEMTGEAASAIDDVTMKILGDLSQAVAELVQRFCASFLCSSGGRHRGEDTPAAGRQEGRCSSRPRHVFSSPSVKAVATSGEGQRSLATAAALTALAALSEARGASDESPASCSTQAVAPAVAPLTATRQALGSLNPISARFSNMAPTDMLRCVAIAAVHADPREKGVSNGEQPTARVVVKPSMDNITVIPNTTWAPNGQAHEVGEPASAPPEVRRASGPQMLLLEKCSPQAALGVGERVQGPVAPSSPSIRWAFDDYFAVTRHTASAPAQPSLWGSTVTEGSLASQNLQPKSSVPLRHVGAQHASVTQHRVDISPAPGSSFAAHPYPVAYRVDPQLAAMPHTTRHALPHPLSSTSISDRNTQLTKPPLLPSGARRNLVVETRPLPQRAPSRGHSAAGDKKLFRGKLTPGEAEILRGREHMRSW